MDGSDAAVVARVRAGDGEAFRALVDPAVPIREAIPAQRSFGAGGSTTLVFTDDDIELRHSRDLLDLDVSGPVHALELGGGPVGDITVGNIFFRSVHNGTQNPAVDTIAAGSTITWTWNADGSHSIRSTGTPAIFRNSVVMGNAGDTYSVTFNTPGTYTYDCGVHGAAMSGRIVVQ